MKRTTGRIRFVAFSDPHIHDWKKYSTDHSRFRAGASILQQVADKTNRGQIPVLFCGDMFHNNSHLSNYELNYLYKIFDIYIRKNTIKMYCISGNHDQSEMSTMTHDSPSYIKMLSDWFPKNIINLDFKTVTHGDFSISGIPYISNNSNYKNIVETASRHAKQTGKKQKILLIHTNLFGALNTAGREMPVDEIPTRMSQFFGDFDLVLSGHIHKPQKLGKHIYMLGAPIHQSPMDEGTEMGIWTVHEGLKMKFHPTRYPKFMYIPDGEEKPDDYNIYLPKKTIKKKQNDQLDFTTDHGPSSLAKKYIKAIKVKNKRKIDLLLKYIDNGTIS